MALYCLLQVWHALLCIKDACIVWHALLLQLQVARTTVHRGCMRSVARAALTAAGVARTTVHIGTGVVWHATKRTSV